MSNMRRGFKGWYILQEDMQGGHVFHEDMFYGLTCFLEDKSYRRTSLIGGHLLLKVIYYGRTCLMRGRLAGGQVVQ